MSRFSYGLETKGDVPLTAWGVVTDWATGTEERREFRCAEADAIAAGYWAHPKGLAMTEAVEWAKAEAARRNRTA
jgi:hypothetical protein